MSDSYVTYIILRGLYDIEMYINNARFVPGFNNCSRYYYHTC